jgi:hypothetical protein
MWLLLSLCCDSTVLGLSTIACFLGYIHNHGSMYEELIYSLLNIVPFAPLVTNLFLLSSRKDSYGYFLPQITAPLHMLLVEAFSCQADPSRAFENLLKYLPFIASKHFRSNIQCSIVKAPYLTVASDRFFHEFLSESHPLLCLPDNDLYPVDSVQVVYDCNPEEIEKSDRRIPIFRPVPVLSARRQNRISFVSLKVVIVLFLGRKAPIHAGGPDRIDIIQPQEGRRTVDPEEIAQEIRSKDTDDINTVVDSAEVKELVMVAFDCSGSMQEPWGRMNRFQGARDVFRKFTKKAYDFKVKNMYRLVQFGMGDPESGDFSLVKGLNPIGRSFRDALNELKYWGEPQCGRPSTWQSSTCLSRGSSVRRPQ